jgi:uncharacterized damage-inducible protein DinB
VLYQFLTDSYATERVKVISVWSMFGDEHLPVRPHPTDTRGRSVHEHMVHQCVSEDLWFRTILGIDVAAPPLPQPETRILFIRRYAQDSAARLAALESKSVNWFAEEVGFFETTRTRAWVLVRRIAHTAQHRGQLLAMARMLGLDLHSTYGPSADTGGLMRDHAPTIYAYPNLEALLIGEEHGGQKQPLPDRPDRPLTERP